MICLETGGRTGEHLLKERTLMSSIQKFAVGLTMIAVSAPAMAVVAVPEPGTFGLMAVGVVALVAASFRKRR
jgi:hypothetical protein